MDQQYIEGTAEGEAKKSNKTLIIILIVVGVLLLCCCIAVVIALVSGFGSGGWLEGINSLLPKLA